MARNFHNSKPIYVILWEIITEIFDSWKFKMSAFFYFWKNSSKNGQIFQLFTLYSKGCHFSITKLDILIFRNILHLDMDFWNLSWKRLVSSFDKSLLKNTINEILKKWNSMFKGLQFKNSLPMKLLFPIK